MTSYNILKGPGGGPPYNLSYVVNNIADYSLLYSGASIVVDHTATRRSLRPKMVSYWEFNNTLADTGRAGVTWSGAGTYTTGPGGVANDALAATAAVQEVVTEKGISSYHTSQAFSYGGFFRSTSISTGGFRYRNGAGGTVPFRLEKSAAPGEGWGTSLRITGSTESVYTGNFSTDWIFVVVTVNNGTVKIYLDGSLATTASVSLGSTAASACDRYALDRTDLDTSRLFFAHDELTADEVSYLYNNGNGRAASDFMTVAYGTTPDAYALTLLAAGDGYWKFDETSGTSAADSVTGGLGAMTGSNGAAMVTTIDPPAGFSSADGVAFTDGANDIFTGPAVNYSSGSLAYTDTFWINPASLTNFDIWTFLGTTTASNANARISFFNQTTIAVPVAQYYSAAAAVLESASSTEHPSIAVGTWASVTSIFDTNVLLNFCNGVAIGGLAVVDQPTAANLTQHFVGGRGSATQTSRGYMSRRAYAKAHALTPSQIAKMHDLGNDPSSH